MNLNSRGQHCINRLMSNKTLRNEYDMTMSEVECLEIKMRDNFQKLTHKEQIVVNWIEEKK